LFCSSAIKTGRYTHAKKARDILEVKALAEQPAVRPVSALPELHKTYNSEQQSARSITERELASSELSTVEIDEVIQQLTAVYKRLNFWTPDVVAKQAEMEKLYLVSSHFIFNINWPNSVEVKTTYMKSFVVDFDGRSNSYSTLTHSGQ
jgi:hypothetical protein